MPMPYYQPTPLQNTYGMQPSMYQQNYQQPQAMQYQAQPTSYNSYLSGKTVNNFSEITANDVPMTGGIAVFPKADLSEIEVRQWNANGTISARSFKPVLSEDGINGQPSEQSASIGITDTFREVLSRLDNIEKLLGKKNSRKTEEVTE